MSRYFELYEKCRLDAEGIQMSKTGEVKEKKLGKLIFQKVKGKSQKKEKTHKVKIQKTAKVKKPKKLGKKTSIGKKINTLAFSIIAVMMILMCVLGAQSLRFSQEYSGVLENISKITFIKSNSSKMANTMINLCISGGSIADSGYIEDIDLMNQYVAEIEENIGEDTKYNQNRNQLNSVKSSVEKYTKHFNDLRAACGENFSSAGAEFAKNMGNEASFMSMNAETLLTFEVTRSEDVQKEIQENFSKTIMLLVFLVVLVGIVAIGLAIKVSRGITKPMQELQKKLAVLANQDLSDDDITIQTNDETRDLGVAFNQMKGNLTDIISKVSHGTGEMKTATSTVDVSIAENAKGSQKISEAIDAMLNRLEEQTAEAKKIMEQMTAMSSISEEVSNSAERIRTSSDDTLTKAGVGSENIEAYVSQMDAVNKTMNTMAEVFKSFSESTKQMNRVLGTISEIAEQTNLLSLNASIEAARAGDAGRGFAVVATEIRKLADDSQNAAQEIGKMINAVQKDAESMSGQLKESLTQLDKGNEIAEETRSSFELIKDGTEVVNDDVQDIINKIQSLADLMAETSDGVQVIHNAADSNVMEINDISAIVTEEAANQEEVSATTTMLANLAGDLEEVVQGFKLKEETEDSGDILDTLDIFGDTTQNASEDTSDTTTDVEAEPSEEDVNTEYTEVHPDEISEETTTKDEDAME